MSLSNERTLTARRTFSGDMKKAKRAIEANKGKIEQWMGAKVYSIEGHDDIIIKMLDTHSGIDYVAEKEGSLFGIACRVQWGCNYESFTIRYKRKSGAKTEYEKRLTAIDNGAFYPAWTMQMYCDASNEIIAAAACKTKVLYEYVKSLPDEKIKGRIITNNDNVTAFFPVWWSEVAHTKFEL